MENEYRRELLEDSHYLLESHKQILRLSYLLIPTKRFIELDAIVFEVPFFSNPDDQSVIDRWVFSAFRFANSVYEERINREFQELTSSFLKLNPELSFMKYMYFILTNFPFFISILTCKTLIKTKHYLSESEPSMYLALYERAKHGGKYDLYLADMDGIAHVIGQIVREINPSNKGYSHFEYNLQGLGAGVLISILFRKLYTIELGNELIAIFNRDTVSLGVRDSVGIEIEYIPEFADFFKNRLSLIDLQGERKELFETFEQLSVYFEKFKLNDLFQTAVRFIKFFLPRNNLEPGSQTKNIFDRN
jgi:hypothetical protein